MAPRAYDIYASKLATAAEEDIMFLDCVSHSCESGISATS